MPIIKFCQRHPITAFSMHWWSGWDESQNIWGHCFFLKNEGKIEYELDRRIGAASEAMQVLYRTIKVNLPVHLWSNLQLWSRAPEGWEEKKRAQLKCVSSVRWLGSALQNYLWSLHIWRELRVESLLVPLWRASWSGLAIGSGFLRGHHAFVGKSNWYETPG